MYHVDESIDEITVYTVEGGLLQAGARVEIEAKVWAWQDGSADTADFYYQIGSILNQLAPVVYIFGRSRSSIIFPIVLSKLFV